MGADYSYAEINLGPTCRIYDSVQDHYLSTPQLRVKLSGMTHTRLDKLAVLAERPELLDYA